MLRKLLFIAFAIILFGFLAKTYHLEDAQIIILSQQIKVSINFIVGILMVVIAFTVIHSLATRVSIHSHIAITLEKKYRHDKTINKRQKAISGAPLLYQVNDQFDQAVHQFHEASQLDDQNPVSEQLSAINNLILAGNIETAQSDLTEVSTRDPKLKAAALYLQAKIFHKKGQPISAITSIKQIKGFEQSPQATKLLVSCYDQGKQYQELLQFLTQRSVLLQQKKAIDMRSTHQNHRRSDQKKPNRRWHSLLSKNLIILQQSAQCIDRLRQLSLLISKQQRTEQAIRSPPRSTDHKR